MEVGHQKLSLYHNKIFLVNIKYNLIGAEYVSEPQIWFVNLEYLFLCCRLFFSWIAIVPEIIEHIM